MSYKRKQTKEEQKKDEGFLMIPDSYMKLKSDKIGTDEIVLLVKIMALSKKMDCIATNAFLAEYFNTSESTIKRYLKNLTDAGLISSIHNPKSISHRILKANTEKIDEMIKGVGHNCASDNNKGQVNYDLGVGHNCARGRSEVSQGWVNSGFENADNPSNTNASQPLKDNNNHNKKDNNISAEADASAKADVNNSFSLLQNRIIQNMKEAIKGGKLGKQERDLQLSDDELFEWSKSFYGNNISQYNTIDEIDAVAKRYFY